eukprot:1894111-Pyramimonas_sp.AAC.1
MAYKARCVYLVLGARGYKRLAGMPVHTLHVTAMPGDGLLCYALLEVPDLERFACKQSVDQWARRRREAREAAYYTEAHARLVCTQHGEGERKHAPLQWCRRSTSRTLGQSG